MLHHVYFVTEIVSFLELELTDFCKIINKIILVRKGLQ